MDPQANADKLLLTSLDSFWSIIRPIMDALNPQRICEIGIGNGDFSRRLIGDCRQRSASYIGVDPSTSSEFADELQGDNVQFVRKASLDALDEIDACDLYFIDGDHNYYTVKNELESIRRAAPEISILILHDVDWPWARRDQYCDPDAIPEAYRHQYSRDKKVAPGDKCLAEHGFSGEESDYSYAAALEEGGAGNGVLTAVDDFVSAHASDAWRLLLIPAVFGLGILYRRDQLSEALRGHISDLEAALDHCSDLFALMERNRIDLFLAFTDNLRHIRSLSEDYRELKDSYRELKDSYKDLQKQYQALHKHERGLAKHAADLLDAYKDLRKYADRLEERVRELQNPSEQ